MKRLIALLVIMTAALGLALFMGESRGSIMVFWPPYRISLSLNLALLLLLAAFALGYLALRGLLSIWTMPRKAQLWRSQHQERSMYQHLLQAHLQLWTGRFSRAQKSAASALDAARKYSSDHGDAVAIEIAAAHLLAAESAHQLRDTPARDKYLQRAQASSRSLPEVQEALALRAARWALHEGDDAAVWQALEQLPQGAQRRVHALRLKLKAAQLAGRVNEALETARLLIKHNAFSPFVAEAMQDKLLYAYIHQARDAEQLQALWHKLPKNEQELPSVTFAAAQRMLELADSDTSHRQIRARLWPLLKRYPQLPTDLQQQVVSVMARSLGGLEHADLEHIEGLQRQHPHDVPLLYLAAQAYQSRQLWGKAEQALHAVTKHKQVADYSELTRSSWVQLASLAENQGRMAEAQTAWKQAALLV